MLLLLALKLDEIENARTLAIMLASKKDEKGTLAKQGWDQLQEVAFPWAKTAKKREIGEWAQRLAREVSRGPLAVYAQEDPTYRSRLRAKVVAKESLSKEASAALRRISQRLPSSIPRNK